MICEECKSKGQCLKCSSSFALAVEGDRAGQCIACEGKNCSRCDIMTNKCLGCNDGFYLDEVENVCKPCPGSCLKCSSATHCDLCEGEGDYAQSDGFGGCECLNDWESHPTIPFKCSCKKDFI